jgi:hypothetical protein
MQVDEPQVYLSYHTSQVGLNLATQARLALLTRLYMRILIFIKLNVCTCELNSACLA